LLRVLVGGLRLGLRGLLHLGLLRVLGRLLSRFVLAAASAPPMPLRLHLTVVRCRPQLRRGLGDVCRHACTSWCVTLVEFLNLSFLPTKCGNRRWKPSLFEPHGLRIPPATPVVTGKPSGYDAAVYAVRHLLRVDSVSAAPHSASKKSMRTAVTKAPFRPNAICSQLRFPISATSDRLLNLAQARSATGTG